MKELMFYFWDFLPLVLIVQIGFMAATLVAALNMDSINLSGSQKLNKYISNFSKSGWFGKIWHAPSWSFMHFAQSIENPGWKVGIVYAYPTIKWAIFFFSIWFIYLFWGLVWVLIWPLIKTILIIIAVIIVLAIFFAR